MFTFKSEAIWCRQSFEETCHHECIPNKYTMYCTQSCRMKEVIIASWLHIGNSRRLSQWWITTQLHELHFSGEPVKKNEMGGARGTMMGKGRCCSDLLGIPEGRRPLGSPRFRLEDNIKMDLQDVWWVYMDWIGLDQGRDRWLILVNVVMKFRIVYISGTSWNSSKPFFFFI